MWTNSIGFSKLTVKMFLGILGAMAVSLAVYSLLTVGERKYISHIQHSPSAYMEQLTDLVADLQDYVTEAQLSLTDKEAVRLWDKRNSLLDIQLIHDSTIVYDSLDYMPNYTSRIGNIYSPVPPSVQSHITFVDGKTAIYISPLYTQRLEKQLDYLILAVSFLTLCLLLIWQLHRLVRDIVVIDKGIRQLESGDLSFQIHINRRDELEDLAESINRISSEISRQITQETADRTRNYDMVTSVSHDIRTPLTTIIGYAELLSGEDQLSEKSRSYLSKIIDRSYLIKDMTDHLFLHFLNGKQENRDDFEVITGQDFICYVLENMAEGLGDHGYQGEFSVDIHEEFFMKVDTVQIRRVFYNLEDNLRKYAAPHMPIRYHAVLEGPYLIITGHNHVTGKTGAESYGVGMKTCMEIITGHGGSLEMSVSLDTFTTTIRLPIYHPEI